MLRNIKDRWIDNSKVLIVGGAADDTAVNDRTRNIFVSAFAMSDLMIDKMNICDNRNLGIIEDINEYDAVILTGGHVPTQNKFFEDITYADSYGQRFYTLEDGSYILIENEAAILYRAAYLISEGRIEKICDKGNRYYL